MRSIDGTEALARSRRHRRTEPSVEAHDGHPPEIGRGTDVAGDVGEGVERLENPFGQEALVARLQAFVGGGVDRDGMGGCPGRPQALDAQPEAVDRHRRNLPVPQAAGRVREAGLCNSCRPCSGLEAPGGGCGGHCPSRRRPSPVSTTAG